jgi:chemotaxis protein CheC
MATYTALQIDAFKEMGNIGCGNAATALSTMMNTMVNMEITKVDVLTYDETIKQERSSEMKSLLYEVVGDLQGFFWFQLAADELEYICTLIAGDLGVEHELVITEIGNILSGSYLRALSDMMGFYLDLGTPIVSSVHDYVRDAAPEGITEGGVVYIQNNLIVEGRIFNFYINLVLNQPSLQKLLGAFGLA